MTSDSLPLAEQAEWDLALCRSVDNILASSHNVLNNVRRASTFTDDENSVVNPCAIIPGVNTALPRFGLTKSGDTLPTSAASNSVMDTLRTQLGECRDVLRQVDSERRYFRERALIMQRSLDEYEREREQQRMRAARTEDELRRAQHTAMDAQAKSRRAEAVLLATTEKHVHLQRFLRSIPISPEAAQELAPDRRFEEAFNDKMAVIKYHRRYMCVRLLFERRAEDAEALRMRMEDALEAALEAALPSGGGRNSLSSSGLWPRAPNEAAFTCAGPIAHFRRRSAGPDGGGAHSRKMELERSREMELERSRVMELERSRVMELERSRVMELERSRVMELERSRVMELERSRVMELERKLSEATQSRSAARRRALHTLQNLITLHCAYVESMGALRTAAGGGKGFTAVIEEPRDAFAELALWATDAALDDVRYETRLSEAVQVDIAHAEAVTAAARAVAITKTKTKTRPQQTYQPRTYQQQTKELKTYQQQTQEPKTYQQQTKEPKTHVEQTHEPKTYEQQTQELKTYQQQTQELKTYQQQTQEPKTYQQQTKEPKTHVEQTHEPKTYEQQTQELKTYEQQTQELKTYEQQTQELKAYEQQTKVPKTHVEQTHEPKTYEQQTQELKTYEQRTQELKTYEQQTQELKTYEQRTQELKTYEQQTQELKTYEQRTQELKTYEQQTKEPKTYEQQTKEPKTYEQQTQEPRTYEQQTQEPKTYEQQTQEPRTYEQQTQEPKTYEQQTQEPRIYEQQTQEPKTYEQQTQEPKTHVEQTHEPKAHEGCAKGLRKRQAAVAAAEPMPHVRIPLDTRRASSRAPRPMPLERRMSSMATVTLPQFASSWRR